MVLLLTLIEPNNSQPTIPPRKRQMCVGVLNPNSFVLLWLMPETCSVNHKKSLEVTKCWDKWTILRVWTLDAESVKPHDPSFTSCAVLNQEKHGLWSPPLPPLPWQHKGVVWSGSLLMTCQWPLVKCIIEVLKRSVSGLLFSSFLNVLMNSVYSWALGYFNGPLIRKGTFLKSD